ncbi:MAG: phosphatidylserine decarboxylase family protein [Muribaculaceae bacterium]|nr:phosphatidylserine decarboxylase family protein [Muribaculaceae bacterium]
MKVKIHSEGTNILVILLLLLAVVNTSAWLFIRPLAIPIIFSSISLIIYLLVLNFFRSPRRHFEGDNAPDLVVSSVDGKVVALEETYEAEYLKCRCIQLSVFMTVFNVHANWFPVNGKVLEVRHFPGRFMSAFLPKSSIENEHSSVLIKTDCGAKVVVNQVAGALARRIVTYAEAGDTASIEDHMGFIKFGSRVDIFLPLDAKVLVKIGDKAVGGITPVACLPTIDEE